MQKAFRQLEEKHLSAEVVHMVWSPRMDLIALANVQGEVLLHRLTWQRVWALPSNENTKQVTSLAWRPDGKVLAVGYESGDVLICDVENAEVLHTNAIEGAISCLNWIEASEKLRCDDVKLDIDDAVNKYLPRFPAASKSYSSLSKLFKEESVEDSKKLEGQECLNILIVGTKTGDVHLYAFGICPIAVTKLSKETSNQITRVLSAALSTDLKSLHCVFEEESCHFAPNKDDQSQVNYNVNFITFATPLLTARHQEIALFALKYGRIITLVEYLNNTLKTMSEAYEDILVEMESKLSKYAETKCTPGTVNDDFLQLLMWGKCSPELQAFLLHDLTEKGLKKMGQSGETSYTNIQQLITKHIHSIGKALFYHLNYLKGMSIWFDKYGVIGLNSSLIESAISAVGSFILKANELLQVIEISLQNFKAFFRWIYMIILRLSEESIPTEISRMTQKDITFVADFLKENLQQDKSCEDKGSGFNLERVGQYLKREDLTIPTDVSSNSWQTFVDLCPNLRHSKLLFSVYPNKSLDQLFDVLEEEIKACLSKTSSTIGESLTREGCVYQLYQSSCVTKEDPYTPCISQFTLDKPSSVLYTVITTEKPPSDKLHIIKKSTTDKSVPSVLEVQFTTLGDVSADDENEFRCSRHGVLDVGFYDENILSLLLQEDESNGENFSVLVQLPIGKILETKDREYKSISLCQPQVSTSPVLVSHDMGAQVKTYRRLENMKASIFAVSGPRRVSCVMFSSHRRVRVFDMDAEDEEGDADIEDDAETDEVDDKSKEDENNDSMVL